MKNWHQYSFPIQKKYLKKYCQFIIYFFETGYIYSTDKIARQYTTFSIQCIKIIQAPPSQAALTTSEFQNTQSRVSPRVYEPKFIRPPGGRLNRGRTSARQLLQISAPKKSHQNKTTNAKKKKRRDTCIRGQFLFFFSSRRTVHNRVLSQSAPATRETVSFCKKEIDPRDALATRVSSRAAPNNRRATSACARARGCSSYMRRRARAESYFWYTHRAYTYIVYQLRLLFCSARAVEAVNLFSLPINKVRDGARRKCVRRCRRAHVYIIYIVWIYKLCGMTHRASIRSHHTRYFLYNASVCLRVVRVRGCCCCRCYRLDGCALLLNFSCLLLLRSVN